MDCLSVVLDLGCVYSIQKRSFFIHGKLRNPSINEADAKVILLVHLLWVMAHIMFKAIACY